MFSHRRLGTCSLLFFVGLPFGLAARAAGGEPSVDFARDIRPLLAKNCFECHGPDAEHRKADLRLDVHEGLFEGRKDGAVPVAPGKPLESELVRRIRSDDPDERMPPPSSGRELTVEEIELVIRWVEGGAPWSGHWAFEPPRRASLPDTAASDWPSATFDAYVLARLEARGLAPSPEAPRAVLLRRVSLDLIGLPPSPDAIAAFLNDTRPDAYERQVDELLASPRFGERWARVWLDLARYADTQGYEKDPGRVIWRYRDWVIGSLNADMPYDEFTIEQLAGDLLPNATPDQVLATAFHRNTMTNTEGGTDDEEFRIAAVKDRVDTTMQVWMGLTMGCAKCHSHKYDPITLREYYSFYAFFNQTEDSDRFDDAPLMEFPTPEERGKRAKLEAAIAEGEKELAERSPERDAAFERWLAELESRGAPWELLRPETFEAASGAALKLLDDGSVLAGGDLPAKETYTVLVPVSLPRVTALRLEAIPDSSQPRGGAGRAKDDGNFVLSRFRVAARGSAGERVELPLARAEADFSQGGYPVEHAIRSTDLAHQGWAVAPRQQEKHEALFVLEEPLDSAPIEALEVALDHQFEFAYPGFAIGRFRLWATSLDSPSLGAALPDSVTRALARPRDERTPKENSALWEHFLATSPTTAPEREKLAALRRELGAIRPAKVPIFRELPEDKRRVTRIHERGNFLSPGEVVEPATPAAFQPFPESAPRSRLGVAQWLVSRENPLTARVAVNRVWARLFGRGLVETEEDFGTQGTPPTYPEVLDSLALEFMDGGWSQKKLMREIVLSATYRQDSIASPDLARIDPENRLLARGPRFRLEAEMLRDTSLATAGLLSSKMFGPSVMPLQPEGIWQSTYNTSRWVTSQGVDRHRRGIYTYIKRTSPYPAMVAFDAPSREVCTVRRIRTNTPLQALVTLNDPAFIEAAQGLARRSIREEGGGFDEETARRAVARAFSLSMLREPDEIEGRELLSLFDERLAFYRTDSEAAKLMATEPLGGLPPRADAAPIAALTVVANVIFNLDEFLVKN